MRAAVLSSLLLVASAAKAQVTLDAFANQPFNNLARYSLTVGSGTNRALAVFVHVSTYCGAPLPTVVSVTYAGVPLMRILARPMTGCTGSTSELWALPPGTEPTSGTNTVEARVTIPADLDVVIHSGAISATGVDQATTFATTGSNDGNSATASLTLGASGPSDLVIDSVCTSTSIGSTPQVSRWVSNQSNYTPCDNSAGATAAGGTTALSWSVTANRWAMVAAAFKAAASQTVAFDAVAKTPSATGMAYPLTVGSGANRALAVFTHIGAFCGTPEPVVNAVTFAGTPLIPVVEHPSATCVGASGSLWTLPPGTEPATGTHDVVVNVSGTLGSSSSIHSGAFSALGVDQTTTWTSFAATDGSGAIASLTLGASGTDDLVVDGICNGGSLTSTAQTQRWLNNLNANNSCNNSGGATAAGGTTSLSWDGGNDLWHFVGGSFKAAAAQDAGDGGIPDGGGLRSLIVGCDCSSAGGPLVVAALVAVALRSQRRRVRDSLVSP